MSLKGLEWGHNLLRQQNDLEKIGTFLWEKRMISLKKGETCQSFISPHPSFLIVSFCFIIVLQLKSRYCKHFGKHTTFWLRIFYLKWGTIIYTDTWQFCQGNFLYSNCCFSLAQNQPDFTVFFICCHVIYHNGEKSSLSSWAKLPFFLSNQLLWH